MAIQVPVGWATFSQIIGLTGDAEPMRITWALGPGGFTQTPAAALILAQNISVQSTSTGRPFDPLIRQNQWTYIGTEVKIETPTGPVGAVDTINSPGAAGAGFNLPQNCAYLVQKRTARGGRSGRGRVFVPCCTFQEGDVGNTGDILTSVVSVLQTRWNAWLAALPGQIFLAHGPDANGFAQTPDAITTLSVQQRIATQRTRLRR